MLQEHLSMNLHREKIVIEVIEVGGCDYEASDTGTGHEDCVASVDIKARGSWTEHRQ